MQTRVASILIPSALLLIGSPASAQDIYVNGQPVPQQEIRDLQQRMGIPEAAPIPAGRYWYDRVSGLWGMEGGPTQGQILPGLELGTWQGIGGPEGGPALFNIAAAAAQAGGAGGGYGGYTRRTPFGSTGGDGNCSYFMSPDGSSVMNCP
jgi:hypothetical protein